MNWDQTQTVVIDIDSLLSFSFSPFVFTNNILLFKIIYPICGLHDEEL